MKRSQRRFVVSLTVIPFLLTAALSAHGQVTISARLDRQAATVNEQFNLIVQVEISEGQIENEPIVPQMDGLVTRTPYTSQSTQFIMRNNQMTSKATMTFTYPVYARKEGTYRIEGIAVVHEGKRYTANPVEIIVGKGTAPAVGTGQTQASPQFQSGTGLELVAEFHPAEVYQGQQVILTFTLKTDQQLEHRPQFENVDVNTFRGFFMYDVTPNPIVQSRAESEGQKYFVLEVGRFALFPVASGELTVPPVNMTVFLPDNRPRGFGFFEGFFREPRRARVASKAVALKVKPLATASQPADFQGAVGRLSLSARTTRRELEMGDALSLVVEARGEANFRALGSPVLPPLEKFTVYDSKVDEQISTAGGRISGAKIWEYVVVPEAEGQQEIGPVKLIVFNPDIEGYQTLTTDPIPITVEKSSRQKGDRIVIRGAGGRQKEVVLEGEDFRYIMTDADKMEDRSGLLVAKPSFLALNAVPVVVVILALTAERRRNRLARDPVLARRLKAPAHAREILAEAEKVKGRSDGELDALLSKALVEFLDLRFGIPARGMVSEQLAHELSERGVREDLTSRVTEFLGQLDESRFARPDNSVADADGRLRQARELIQALSQIS